MADMSALTVRVRNALEDFGEQFRMNLPGGRSDYEIGYQRVTDVVVSKVAGPTAIDLVEGTDYVLEPIDSDRTWQARPYRS
ncbi:hypothetical protein [Nonomuraea sp. NEAU-A123]|uniref:hypothetical protein n=1 Tax=Nonomuraea sp. NEAU-A123 TaxID=2839649 RepID=UPI001BE4A3C3|nr:hypothetical protein [Nonomuraea sp. NEAU-A123]MBT2232527.1 hypothetical protein [Nonomuraea sp. NEAU-A123]